VISSIRRAAKRYKARSLYIATDNHDMRDDIMAALPDLRIAPLIPPQEHLSDVQDVHSSTIDLAVLAQADFFIANWYLSFSSSSICPCDHMSVNCNTVYRHLVRL
jgi:hypothetical protein